MSGLAGFIAGFFIGGMFSFVVLCVLFIAREDKQKKTFHKQETFRERLTKEHPEWVSDLYSGGCRGCPSDHGYESMGDGLNACREIKRDCTACWDREVKA